MKLLKTKTFWTGAAGVVVATVGYLSGEFTAAGATQTSLTCLIGIFLRDAIE